MKYAAITSMSQKYRDHCGNAMLESYKKHWSNIPLYLYNEDFDYKARGVITQGWNLGIDYKRFQQRWENKNKKVSTFAKKGFSIIHAMENIDCDRLIWLDADSICKRNIHEQLLDLISPDTVLSTHFGVVHDWPSDADPHRKMFSCETGFFILNKKHTQFETFLSTYKDIYINDRELSLRRFYDGEVYGETVRLLETQGAEMLDLNPGNTHKTPIPRSLIEPYISHYKAGLKDNLTNDFLLKEHNIDEV